MRMIRRNTLRRLGESEQDVVNAIKSLDKVKASLESRIKKDMSIVSTYINQGKMEDGKHLDVGRLAHTIRYCTCVSRAIWELRDASEMDGEDFDLDSWFWNDFHENVLLEYSGGSDDDEYEEIVDDIRLIIGL